MKKIITVIMLICITAAFSATITWRKYKEIYNDVFISSTDVLIIEAGTVLRFAPEVKLTVYGQIHSMGTQADPVIFTWLDKYQQFWEGIDIISMSGNSDFNYTKFFLIKSPIGNPSAGMNIVESACTISNCIFSENRGDQGGALKITGGNVTVNNTVFYNNSSTNGGALNILNNSSLGPSQINLSFCKFSNNNAAVSGGAVYIKDDMASMNNMDLNINNCAIFGNESGEGGGIYYNNLGHIDLSLEKSKIFNNKGTLGSGVYMKFMETAPGAILAQKFSNLLIFKNLGILQSGVYINMGQTVNPFNLKFSFATIAYNSIIPSKNGKGFDSGIHIKSNGNYPKIANSIIWGNESNFLPSNFFIEDGTNPNISNIFWYCDILGYIRVDNNLSRPPVFVRPPEISDFFTPETFDEDRYDFHESLFSPCVDAGDPAEPCMELNSTRVNMGAYGNTIEATPKNFSVVPATSVNTFLNINGATVVDFENKAIKLSLDEINLTSGSQLFLRSAQNSDITTKRIITQPAKFNESYAKIQTLRDSGITATDTPVQSLTVTEDCQLINSDIFNISLNVLKNVSDAVVNIQNSKFFVDSLSLATNPLLISGASNITIIGSKFIDCTFGGITVTGNTGATGKSKTAGDISGNTISFNSNIILAGKAGGTPKRIGIEVVESNINVENNEIEGGDEGISMKTNSSGRISNNSISFDTDIASKKGIYDKTAIIVSGNSNSSEISENLIINEDDGTLNVTGIEINASFANILYNTIDFDSCATLTRTGIKIISPTNKVNVYNNTIFNTLQAFVNIPSSSKADIINNIYWTDSESGINVNDTTNFRFYNNDFVSELPSGIVGSGNISADPEFFDTDRDDFTLVSTSPCINAGMVIAGVHLFDAGKAVFYYGTAPDIGAEELYQELVTPSNITTSVTGTNFTFSWDPVPGFFYEIYASDNPYSEFNPIGTTTNTYYTVSISTSKKFYYVLATTDPSKSGSFIAPVITDNKETVKQKIIPEAPKKKIIRIKNSSGR
jgi:predicted outer membrane repeat protein